MLDPIIQPRDDGATERLVIAAVVATVVHLVILAAVRPVHLFGDPEPLPEVRSDRVLAMTLVDEDELESPEPQRQYVSLPRPEQEERPDDAQFYDRFERSVEEETVNRDDVLSPSPVERVASASQPPSSAPPQRERAASANPPARAPAPTVEPDEDDADGVLPEPTDRPDEGDSDGTEPSDAEAQSEGDRSAQDRPFALRDLVAEGNPESDALVAAASRRNDYIDVADGDRTAINSLRSMYWSFFQRMQEQLSEEWDPNAVLRRHDPTTQLYGRSDRYTVLSVTLDGDGSLRHVVVSRSSDLAFLDDEAIRAFQVAAPFPNVPEGLKDENGQVTFQFGFHVSFERGTMRIRRVN